MLTSRQIGWIVGFLEGEGSFSWHRSGTGGTPMVAAGQVQLEPLTRMLKYVGGHIYQKNRKPPKVPWNHWSCTGPMAAGLMMTVYAEMSPRRQGQIRATLARWREQRVDFRYRTHCKQGHPYDATNTRTYINYNGRPARECRACRRDIYSKRPYGRRRLRLLKPPASA